MGSVTEELNAELSLAYSEFHCSEGQQIWHIQRSQDEQWKSLLWWLEDGCAIGNVGHREVCAIN